MRLKIGKDFRSKRKVVERLCLTMVGLRLPIKAPSATLARVNAFAESRVEDDPKVAAISRRTFMKAAALAMASISRSFGRPAPAQRAFLTRGVVLYPFDLSLDIWPRLAHQAGLTTIALHASLHTDVLMEWVQSEAGKRFHRDCRRYDLEVEYELHAMGDLLSREYANQNLSFFRQNKQGQRVPDFNCCPSSLEALDIIGEKALAISKILKPSTHRYFYWPDDGREWCFCTRCRGLTASEQALLVENRVLKVLRKWDGKAQVSHLAYGPTLAPPRQVQPDPGIFVEFAPIHRSYEQPYAAQSEQLTEESLEMLQKNLVVFGSAQAQVLEYWLDVSRFSGWKRPAIQLPWRRDVFLADLQTYAKLGIRHVTSFACYIDADYRRRYPDFQFLSEYGQGLLSIAR